MDEITIVKRLRADVPTDTDLTIAHQRFRAGMPEGAGTPVRARTRRSFFQFAIAGGAAAALVTTAIVVATDHRPEPRRTPTTEIVAFTEKAATAALKYPDPVPRPGQWIYQKIMVGGNMMKGMKGRPPQPPRTAEQWWPADKGRHPEKAKFGMRTDYPYLQSLPTEPHALLARIRHDAPEAAGTDRGEFLVLYRIVRDAGVLPPRLRPTLYRALALIPGGTVQKDAVDAAGRHGVALVWTIRSPSPQTDAFIFDRKTYRFLGEQDTAQVNGATMTYSSALLGSGVVDREGQRP
ncbi:CU044_5270 family protein [Actinoallomurus sp. NPDC050550]|uniref:CU044_5270 family protein n=1 Tax=Actinoallomurus sp. NPDC050550 TaxID=3154937 RepID=UPI0033CB27D1